MTATDTSAGALEVARANAERLGLAGRVEFRPGTLPDGAEFDLVLANLPYVPSPTGAVCSRRSPSGSRARRCSPAPTASTPTAPCSRCRVAFPGMRDKGDSAVVGLEVGEGQAAAVGGMLREAGFAEVAGAEDLAGIERVLVGRR